MVAAAVAAGIPLVGLYIVPRTPGPSIEAQVNFAIAEADRQFPQWRTLPGYFWQVDLEHWSYDKVAPQHGVTMAALLRAKTGKPTILYAPRWAYGNTIGGSDLLWASSYGSNPDLPFREAYERAGGNSHPGWAAYSGRVPTILQYGARTTIGGQGICDANAFRGTVAELAALVTGNGDHDMWTQDQINTLMFTLVDNRAGGAIHVRDALMAQSLARLEAAVSAIASRVDIDPAELDAIKNAAATGAAAGVAAGADELAAALAPMLDVDYDRVREAVAAVLVSARITVPD
jgi:hypothetical protein